MPSQLWSPRPPSDRSVNPTANADAARTIALTALPANSKPPPSSPDVLNVRHTDRGTNPHSFHPGPRVQPATLLLLAQSVRKPPTGRAATVPMERPATAAYASRRALLASAIACERESANRGCLHGSS